MFRRLFNSSLMKQQVEFQIEHADHTIASFTAKKGQKLRVALRVGSNEHSKGVLEGSPSLELNGERLELSWGFRGDVFLPIKAKENVLKGSNAKGFVYIYCIEVI